MVMILVFRSFRSILFLQQLGFTTVYITIKINNYRQVYTTAINITFSNFYCINATTAKFHRRNTQSGSESESCRVVQKKIAQNLMQRTFAIVCSRITRFSSRCSEINWQHEEWANCKCCD